MVRRGMNQRIGGFEIKKILDYLRNYPDFLSEIMQLHQAYDLDKLRSFFEELDLSRPYSKKPMHKSYIEYKQEMDKVIMKPDTYSISVEKLDQDFLDVEHVIRCFDSSAEDYDAIVNKFWPFGRKEAMEILDPQYREKILEVGIGPGSNFQLYPKGCEIVGIDISEEMVKKAKQKALQLQKDIRVLLMDAHSIDFPQNYFDKVYSFYALCDVRNPFKVTNEIKRVCKPGGIVVFFEPIKSTIDEVAVLQFLFWPIGKLMGHVWIEGFPAYKIPYNSYLMLLETLRELTLRIETDIVFDPPYEIVHLIKCVNSK